MSTRYEPLPNPILDPRNERELVELALTRTYDRSNRTLNDLSPGSVLRVFAEMMAFAAAELLFYVNKLPFAFVIQFLQIQGIQRRLGSPAVVSLRFSLSQAVTEAQIIPKGTPVLTADRRRKFLTDAQLVIPAGQTFGIVSATCSTVGEGGNLPPYSITQLLQSLPYLSSVTNLEASTGGSGAETLKETQTRAMLALRRRGLISQDDFENKVRAILGQGSVALAVGNLGEDGLSFFLGCVHVFVLNADGSQPNQTQRDALKAQLRSLTQIGIELFVSAIDVRPVTISIVVRSVAGTDPQVVASGIGTKIRNFLAPGKLPAGEALLVDDLRHQIRTAGGVQFVESVAIGESLESVLTSNFPLKYPYSVAKVEAISIALSDGKYSYRYNV